MGLDFLATTEHNTVATHPLWGPLAGDDLLVLLGQEVMTPAGHWLAVGIDPGQEIDSRDAVGRQLDRVRRAGGISVAAHPHAPYPTGAFRYAYQGFDVVEVWNGRWSSDLPWQADNEAALADWGRGLAEDVLRGRWRPAIANSDTHRAGQIGIPHTVVRADELTSAAILAGLRAGHSWLAASPDVRLSLEVVAGDRRVGIGERFQTEGETTLVRTQVRGVPSGTVSFHTDRGTAHQQSLPADDPGAVEWETSADEAAFVRVEVRYPGGQMAALTNPVILTGPGQAAQPRAA
jgi:hypothetical protein